MWYIIIKVLAAIKLSLRIYRVYKGWLFNIDLINRLGIRIKKVLV